VSFVIRSSIVRTAAVSFAALLFLASATNSIAQQVPVPRIVSYVQGALQQGDLASAAALVSQYRRLNGDTPEAMEAFSWQARGELAAGKREQAMKDAEAIQQICQTSLATRKVDAEPHLPLALGAAYEVQAEALATTGKRAEAIQMLQAAQRAWRGTSLVDRLQKNLNLLTLEGKPAPAVHAAEWLGTKPAPQTSWRGKAVLLFFWAHWCSDCKAEAPVISQIAAEYEPKGLRVVAPTRRYGYTAAEEHAAPSAENAFIEQVFNHYYAGIPQVEVPLDGSNFERFGASTTPTIVVVDRRGIVRLYHPGVVDGPALRSAVENALAAGPRIKPNPSE
jgi:thiol-disulfide isomerase/thioredoxin